MRFVQNMWMVLGAVSLVACTASPLDCGQRPDDATHGNAGCLVVRADQLLMVQQRGAGHWALPGGTAKAGERAACTAARETAEETGVPVSVGPLLHQFENGFRLYHCSADDSQPLPQDTFEVAQAAWLDAQARDQVTWRFRDQRPFIESLVEAVSGDR